MSLAPGGHAVIVKRRDAFILRYGADGRLQNCRGMEQVGSLPEEASLQLTSRAGSPLETVTYQDDVREARLPQSLSDATGWRDDAPSPERMDQLSPSGKDINFPQATPLRKTIPTWIRRATWRNMPEARSAKFRKTLSILTHLCLRGRKLSIDLQSGPAYRPSATFQIEQSTNLANWTSRSNI